MAGAQIIPPKLLAMSLATRLSTTDWLLYFAEADGNIVEKVPGFNHSTSECQEGGHPHIRGCERQIF